MEVVVGFMEGEGNHKLVPWISWDDWNSVRESLFSSSPDSALQRISAWRGRGCLPVIIEVTASIVETQQKDPFFRDGISGSHFLADNVLTMLYCMTIMRLVNGIVEKTRKKNEVSIGEAADVIGIPRMLIDIRHECSHRDLPSLRLVRLASTKKKKKKKKKTTTSCGKREADTPLLVLDDSDVKKVKGCEEEDFEGVKNGLMIGGLWKSVTDDEVMNMASSVRILV